MRAGTESGDRARFLDALRARLRAPTNPVHPLPVMEGRPPPVEYATSMDDPLVMFTEVAINLGVLVHTISSEEIATVLDEALALAGDGPVMVTDEPETAGISDLLRARNRELITSAGIQAMASACLGVTGALAGIARTGTIVVDSTRSGTRLASLLPPVHLAFLKASAILPDQGALLRSLSVTALPSNLVLITGPSRTGDIELVLTVGVHGPGRLLVAILS